MSPSRGSSPRRSPRPPSASIGGRRTTGGGVALAAVPARRLRPERPAAAPSSSCSPRSSPSVTAATCRHFNISDAADRGDGGRTDRDGTEHRAAHRRHRSRPSGPLAGFLVVVASFFVGDGTPPTMVIAALADDGLIAAVTGADQRLADPVRPVHPDRRDADALHRAGRVGIPAAPHPGRLHQPGLSGRGQLSVGPVAAGVPRAGRAPRGRHGIRGCAAAAGAGGCGRWGPIEDARPRASASTSTRTVIGWRTSARRCLSSSVR